MSSFNTLPRTLQAFEFEQVAVSNTAAGYPLTAAKYMDLGTTSPRNNARAAMITVDTDSIRYRIDGTAPTASVGHIMFNGDTLWLDSYHAITNFKAIRVTNDATLNVTYLR